MRSKMESFRELGATRKLRRKGSAKPCSRCTKESMFTSARLPLSLNHSLRQPFILNVRFHRNTMQQGGFSNIRDRGRLAGQAFTKD